ncbi:MAG: hypothetical protein A2288_01490 [Candidatus Moranbacteria bacterium RIFOXYA12_FULL_44_15]|nr:MAG: hypothetical protein A2288_01490 [Candidatus Moranbacteria bacterium RIFOXYA12_FULL_44_15]OGI34377.1 MAG: hypothetical protein A2259_04665 [Candidatus Moranbacteria bacterium RIFOXYA2_FULL_43_15]
MKNILNFKSFWITALAASAVIFVVSLNAGRTNVSRVEIMLIPKSGAAAQNIDGILANFENIVESLPFFDRVIAEDSRGLEHIEELPDYKRADLWEDKIKVKRKNGSFVLSIEVKDKDAVLAEDLAWRVSQTFSRTVSLYYNVRTELDARIIEGPVTEIGTVPNKLYLLALSALTGFLAIYFSFYISDKVSGKISQSKESYPEREFSLAELSQKFSKDKFGFERKKEEQPAAAVQKEVAPKKELPIFEEEIKNQEDYVFSSGKKSMAPDNLPIAPDNLPIAEENISLEKVVEEKKKEEVTREATPEEVKRRLERLQGKELDSKKSVIFKNPTPEEAKERLNRLLSGKF